MQQRTTKWCRRFGLMVLAIWMAILTIRIPAYPNNLGSEQIDGPGAIPPWLEFSPRGAPFSVRLPGTPKASFSTLDSGRVIAFYTLEFSGSEFGIEWATNLPNETSLPGAVDRLLARVVKDLILSAKNTGIKDATRKHDGDIIVDGLQGRESILEGPGGRIQVWGFLVPTVDIERPGSRHDFVGLLSFDSGNESPSQASQVFFGSLSLRCSPLSAPPPSDLPSGIPPDLELGVDTIPEPLHRPKPVYTAEARKAHVQGIVKTRALVAADGLVKDVRVLNSLPSGLGEQAIKAVKKMRFRPATKSGQRVAFCVTVDVEFRLQPRTK